MTDQGADPMADQMDELLGRYLHWQADNASGLPTPAEMTARVAGRAIPVGHRSTNLRVAWVVLALVALVLAAIIVGSGERPLLGLLTSTPTSGLATQGAVVVTRAPAATLDASPCTTRRIQLVPATSGDVPLAAKPFHAPAGFEIAAAFSSDATSGAVVVIDSAGSARAVATFSGVTTDERSGVRVIAASSSGAKLLVVAGNHASNAFGNFPTCDNLFAVATDGSAVTSLTDNGPSTSITTAAFSPDASQVAYFEGGAVHVAGRGVDRPLAQLDADGCPGNHPDVAWSPDGQRVAIACEADFAIVHVATGSVYLVPVNSQRLPLTVAWADNNSLVGALAVTKEAQPQGPVEIVDITLRTSGGIVAGQTSTVRVTGGREGFWAGDRPLLSSDRSLLLLLGPGGVFPDSILSAVVDTSTGKTTLLPTLDETDSFFVSQQLAWGAGDPPHVVYSRGMQLFDFNLLAQTEESLGGTSIPDTGIPALNFALVQVPG